jgi:hypothetical protein
LTLRSDCAPATSIATREYDPASEPDSDSISSFSTDSESDSDSENKCEIQNTPKIRLFVEQMLEQVQSLYELSSLLRRPKIANKYIRSIQSKSKTVILKDMGISPLNASFGLLDENHVGEKVLQWRGLTKAGHSIRVEEEKVAPVVLAPVALAPVVQHSTIHLVKEVQWLCRRLAKANTRRREQLQYWTDHPCSQFAAPDLTQNPIKQGEGELKSQKTAFKPLYANSSRQGPSLAVSRRSFSTAAISDVLDTKTDTRPRTSYTSTAIGNERSNSVPELPKMAFEKPEFICPYCGMMLNSSEMQHRKAWK